MAARKRLEALVAASGGRVGLLPGKQAQDHYGRTLAHASIASPAPILKRNMLADGARLSGRRCTECRPGRPASKPPSAARDRRGEASGGRSPVLKAEQIQRSGFAVVSGRVRRCNAIEADSGSQLQGRLYCVLHPMLVGQFDSAHLQALMGKQIEARGWVVDRSRRGGLQPGQPRWLLPLTDPSMLQRARCSKACRHFSCRL